MVAVSSPSSSDINGSVSPTCSTSHNQQISPSDDSAASKAFVREIKAILIEKGSLTSQVQGLRSPDMAGVAAHSRQRSADPLGGQGCLLHGAVNLYQ